MPRARRLAVHTSRTHHTLPSGEHELMICQAEALPHCNRSPKGRLSQRTLQLDVVLVLKPQHLGMQPQHTQAATHIREDTEPISTCSGTCKALDLCVV